MTKANTVRYVCGLQMLERIATGMRSAGGDRLPDAAGLVPGARVALMVNSLGATTAMELSVAARAALACLATMQVSPCLSGLWGLGAGTCQGQSLGTRQAMPGEMHTPVEM